MREALAERLLAQVMDWTPEDVANERPLLQAMAALKYDAYQQYAPGMRFVESLALWLRQFGTREERLAAYDFVKRRLVFFSAAEIAHLVTITYPDYIRPLLTGRAARELRVDEACVSRIAESKEYQLLRRQCLFLGLSDGARIDTFRRATTGELNHEQIWPTYEVSPEKATGILSELQADIRRIDGDRDKCDEARFRTVFLLDDFSGSGRSYLRDEAGDGSLAGKIVRFWEQLVNARSGLGQLVSLDDLYIGIVLYIATSSSQAYLEPLLAALFREHRGCRVGVHIVHRLEKDVALNATRDVAFMALVDKYYDPKAEDMHTRKGGTDVRRGFAGCGLPVVLSHNTPNNSVLLLWANPDDLAIRGLFPRVSRHRSEP
jgi:hypothetical protein